MHLEVLVEEPSAEVALTDLLPRIVGKAHTFHIHVHQGKLDLLAKLPGRLRGYQAWLPEDYRIVVLVDNDTGDCRVLKESLEHAAREAGLATKSAAQSAGDCCILNRVAVEELEAWLFGDPAALLAAYPKLPASLGTRPKYRDPDAISGGTWEALERELRRAGYYPPGMPKVETARNVSRHMDPERNRSKSFQVFRDGIRELVR